MWKKANNQWVPILGTYSTTNFKQQLVSSSVFQPYLNGSSAIIFTAANQLNDIFEEFRLFCNSSDATNDPDGFWITGWFDPNQVIANKFNNLHSVNLASSDTTTYTTPITRASVDNIAITSGSPPQLDTFTTLTI